jgi:hypothetical protein
VGLLVTLPSPIEGEAHRQGYEPKKGEQENLHESISVVVRRYPTVQSRRESNAGVRVGVEPTDR